jgi:hypothetical protein
MMSDPTMRQSLSLTTSVRQVVTLHRIVRSDPATRQDFVSKGEMGLIDPRADAETRRLESGLSMYRTAAQARRKARALPFLGGFIAAVRVPMAGAFIVERTTSSAGHHTVWGDAEALLECVVTIEPVAR